MGLLDDAIREHLELKRRRGADPTEVEREEREVLGPVRSRAVDAVADDLDFAHSRPEGYDDEPLADHESVSWANGGSEQFAPPHGDSGLEPESRPYPAAGHHEPEPLYPSAGSHEPAAADPSAGYHEPAAADPSAGYHEPAAADPSAGYHEPDPLYPAAGHGPAPYPVAPHDAEPDPYPAHEPPDHDPSTAEYSLEEASDAEGHPHPGEKEDVLEETPEFLQDTPDHDRLWFEQRPPRDFDFDG